MQISSHWIYKSRYLLDLEIQLPADLKIYKNSLPARSQNAGKNP